MGLLPMWCSSIFTSDECFRVRLFAGLSRSDSQSGFTLIETLLVIGIFSVLAGLGGFLISGLAPKTVSVASEATIIADLRQQQLKAQHGFNGTAHGIAFGSGEYVLFEGSSYSPSEPSNQIIPIEDQLSISTTLPSNVVVFAPASGEPVGINQSQDQVTVTNNSLGTSFTLEINPLGVPIAL